MKDGLNGEITSSPLSSEMRSASPAPGDERNPHADGTVGAAQTFPFRAPNTTPLAGQSHPQSHQEKNGSEAPTELGSTLDASPTEEETGMFTPTAFIDSVGKPMFQLPVVVVYGHAISRLDTLRTLMIDGSLVRFTPTEYRLVIPILEGRGTPVPFRHLTTLALEREPDRDARRLLDKHIDHIRSKLRAFGLNVHGVARFGYVLLAEQ